MKKLFKTLLIIVITLPIFTNVLYAEDYYNLVWKFGEDDKLYWYENNKRQGVYGDAKNIWDNIYGIERGREIYDPLTDAWYWLDAVYDGAIAINKEVWVPYIFQDEEPGSTDGKWVRYDNSGQMIKGWYKQGNEFYYYDLITGAMYKGNKTIKGTNYYFDEITGVVIFSGNDNDKNNQINALNNLYDNDLNKRNESKKFSNHHKEFERFYKAYINAYDISLDGSKEMQEYSNIRVKELPEDFSHNFDKMDAAAIKVGLSEEGLYSPYNEAIQYHLNSNLNDLDYAYVAKRMAKAMKGSLSHWSYVGPASTRSYAFNYVNNCVYLIITTCE